MSVAADAFEVGDTGLQRIVLRLPPLVNWSDDELFRFCVANPELRIERNKCGELIIMPLVGGETGSREADIGAQLRYWAKRDGTGKAFGPSTGFRLPKGAMRSPDASWVRLPRWKALSVAERKKFPPLCPDFIVELRSETDRLPTLREKMKEYIDNGAEMGLLVDPLKRQVHVYRRGRKVKVLDNPETVSCDPELPGFTLDLREIW